MAAHIETQPMPTARLGEPTELILDAGEGNRNPTPEEQVLLGIGPEHLPMPSTVLPYRYQDDYHREISDVEHRVAVLDNGRIRATFLLDLGGRLWTLRDLEGDRELLHQPDVADGRQAQLAGEEPEDVVAGDPVTERRRLLLEGRREVVEGDLVAFESRPRVGVVLGGVDRPDETPGDAVAVLVALEGFERTGQDDPAEVEQHCSDRHGGRW